MLLYEGNTRMSEAFDVLSATCGNPTSESKNWMGLPAHCFCFECRAGTWARPPKFLAGSNLFAIFILLVSLAIDKTERNYCWLNGIADLQEFASRVRGIQVGDDRRNL